MDLLISMRGEPISKAYSPNFSVIYVPTATKNQYFIAEIRENDREKLKRIEGLIPMLEDEFSGNDNFVFERTRRGFKLMKKVDINREYMKEWEDWVRFSQSLFKEIAKAIGEKVPDFEEL